jgi:RNA polymerase sigma-70 factor (ECF subfamily)
MLTIARNLCRDRFRRQRPQMSLSEQWATHAGEYAHPEEVVVRDEQKRALQKAVAELPESQREIVILRLSSGLKFEEIAQLLQIPLGTALSRMHAALERLRKTMDVAYEH